jgi:hypothetical protein
VRSRTHRVRLAALEPELIEEILADRHVGDGAGRRLAAAQAGGSVGLALELLEDGNLATLHQQVVSFLNAPNDISAVTRARQFLDGAGDRDAALRRARSALALLRSSLRESLHASLADSADGTYFSTSPDSWNAIFDQLFEAESDLDLRIAPEQVLTGALLGLQDSLPRIFAPGS